MAFRGIRRFVRSLFSKSDKPRPYVTTDATAGTDGPTSSSSTESPDSPTALAATEDAEDAQDAGDTDADDTANAEEAGKDEADETPAPLPEGEGPWDSSEVAEDSESLLGGDWGEPVSVIKTVSLSLPVTKDTRVELLAKESEFPSQLYFTPNNGESPVCFVLRVYAAPSTGDFWEDEFAELVKLHSSDLIGDSGYISNATGPFGTEIEIADTNGLIQQVTMGVTGKRWMLRCDVFGDHGAEITDEHRELAYRYLHNSVIHRDHTAQAPSGVLSLALIQKNRG